MGNKMDSEAKIRRWIEKDTLRMQALSAAASLGLRDWCLAAGFVRNLVWDKVHTFSPATSLNDIDLIYFDPDNTSEDKDREIEQTLLDCLAVTWSVKNQARMHQRNRDSPYTSTLDAMSYWVEVETAVGAFLATSGEVVLMSPFGFEPLFDCTVTLNSKRPKLQDFNNRVTSKRWLEIWPKLVINA